MGEERRLLPSLPPQAFGRAREAFPAASTALVGLQTVGKPPSVLWPSEPASWPRTCKPALYKKTKKGGLQPRHPGHQRLGRGKQSAVAPWAPNPFGSRGPEWVLDVGPLPLEILGAAISTTPRDSPPRRKRGRSAPEARGWRGTLPAGPASAQRAGVWGIPNEVQVHSGCPP